MNLLHDRGFHGVGPGELELFVAGSGAVVDEQYGLAVEQLLLASIDREQQPHAPAGRASEGDAGQLEVGVHGGIVPGSIGCTAVSRTRTLVLVPLAAGLLAAGCGAANQVTYVDPNGPDAQVQAGDGGEPFVRYGADQLERSRACIALRSTLAVARTMAVTDVSSAGRDLEAAVSEQLAVIEPRGHVSAPKLTTQLRGALERLRDTPPASATAYSGEVRRIEETLLTPVCDVVVARPARQDIGYRAGLLQETLQDAATAYEAAFDGSDRDVQDTTEYRSAYGLLIDASTRQLEAIPEDARPRIRSTLDQITRRSTPAPTPPNSPRSPELVVGELSALADDVVLAARIDPTYPEPSTDAPDQLRTLKREVASAVEFAKRGGQEAALAHVRAADRTGLTPAGSSIAAVSPSLVPELEQALLIAMPDAIRSGGDVAGVASEIDAKADEAIQLVEDELDLLREG